MRPQREYTAGTAALHSTLLDAATMTPKDGGGADEGGALLELARSMVKEAVEERLQEAEAAAKATAACVPWRDRPTSPDGAAADDTLPTEAKKCGSCSGPRDA